MSQPADTDPTISAHAAIHTDEAAPAPRYFAQGVRKGSILQVSGQGALDRATGEVLHRDNAAEQTILALENVSAILAAGGASIADVVMFRIYLTSRDDYSAMNQAYERFVDQHVATGPKPCRTTVFVGLPLDGMLVEIDAQAVVG
ncbi:RidA family protein [Kitasatospora sp. NPDC004669]|uniref:RidA family protein n=1 Tax=Kitasatospora sp. NPDC004669 TaxID=3154555 RepID=UPI0033AF3B5F